MPRSPLLALPLFALVGCGNPPPANPPATAPAVVVPDQPDDKKLTTNPFELPTPDGTKQSPKEDVKSDPKAEKEAEQYVTKFGGRVTRDVSHMSKGQPVFVISLDEKDCTGFELKRMAVFPKLYRLTCSGCKNTDSVLKQLPDLPQVTGVALDGSDATDVGLAAVAALPKLNRLELNRAGKLTPAGFKLLSVAKALEWLDAEETAIDDAAIRELAASKALTTLKLKGTKVKLADTGAAFAGWTKLTHLDLTDTGVGDSALVPIGVAKGLEELRLEGANITDTGLKPLAKLSKLKVLHLGRCAKVTGLGLNDLADLSGLETLYLNDTALTDAGMTAVAKARGVKTLDLDRTKVTDVGVKELATPRALETLSFEETAVGDAGLIAVAEKVKKLEKVGVRKSKVTEKGATEARAKSNNLSVSFD